MILELIANILMVVKVIRTI